MDNIEVDPDITAKKLREVRPDQAAGSNNTIQYNTIQYSFIMSWQNAAQHVK